MSTELQLKKNEGLLSKYSEDQIKLLKSQICKGASDDELLLFVSYCKSTKLDPFSRQIYAIMRRNWNSDINGYENKMTIQTSIDGFRLCAMRTGKYKGRLGPFYKKKGVDKWVDVWEDEEPPFAAKVGVLHEDFSEPLWATAKWNAYAQQYENKKTGNMEPAAMWKKMGDHMLAKCAEALALRAAFPNDLSNIYTEDEAGALEAEFKHVPESKQLNKPIDIGSATAAPVVPTPAVETPKSPVKPKKVVTPVKAESVIETVGTTVQQPQGEFDNFQETGVASSEYKIPFGPFSTKAFREVDPSSLDQYVLHVEDEAKRKGITLEGSVLEFQKKATEYLRTLVVK